MLYLGESEPLYVRLAECLYNEDFLTVTSSGLYRLRRPSRPAFQASILPLFDKLQIVLGVVRVKKFASAVRFQSQGQKCHCNAQCLAEVHHINQTSTELSVRP